MATIDPAVLTNLRDAVYGLKRSIDRQNAINYLTLRHELEKEQEFGKDNSSYLAALKYVTDPHIDLVLSNVVKELEKVRTKR